MQYIETLYIVAVERDNDPRRAPSLDETYVAHTCGECSAIVRDTADHDRWHGARETMDRAVQGFMDNTVDRLDRLERGEGPI